MNFSIRFLPVIARIVFLFSLLFSSVAFANGLSCQHEVYTIYHGLDIAEKAPSVCRDYWNGNPAAYFSHMYGGFIVCKYACTCSNGQAAIRNPETLLAECPAPTSSSSAPSSAPSSCPEGFTLVNGMCAQNASNPEQCPFSFDYVSGICLLDNAECANGELGIRVVVNFATGATQCSPHMTSSSAPTSAPTSSPSSLPPNSSTAQASSTPPSTNSSSNTGNDGNGNGNGNDSGSGSSSGNAPGGGGGGGGGSAGSASSAGGNAKSGDCSSAPTCEGDAIQCAMLNQIWRGQCEGTQNFVKFDADESYSAYENAFNELVDESKNAQYVDEEGILKILKPEEIDVSKDDRFGLSQLETIANSPSSGSCPPPRNIRISLGSFEISYQSLCDLAEQLSSFVVFLFSFMSVKIVFRSLSES